MSISGISANTLFSVINSLQGQQGSSQTSSLAQEFQQLGQDLQSGNLSKAQSDFSILTQNVSNPAQTNSSIAQAFSALGSALQSGNLNAAQQAYKTIQQDLQQSSGAEGAHHHHHHHGQGSGGSDTNTNNSLIQAFGSLGQSLTSGNLTAAQTAYTTLSQDLSQLGVNLATTAQSTATSAFSASA
jgi:hypothetical protein